jgi:hypothetical protein
MARGTDLRNGEPFMARGAFVLKGDAIRSAEEERTDTGYLEDLHRGTGSLETISCYFGVDQEQARRRYRRAPGRPSG